MAAIDFPASPVNGQLFTAPTGVTYQYLNPPGAWVISGLAPVAPGGDSLVSVLSANVAMNVANQFFNGPNTGSIGAAGQKWMLAAAFLVSQPAGGPDFYMGRFWNGAAQVGPPTDFVISLTGGINGAGMIQHLVTLTAPTTFTLQAKNFSSNTGSLLGGSWISATRLT
jgi:hypothetical protein